MADVELFRVVALRYTGPSATKGGYSDKVWAGVILKRTGASTSTLPRGEVWRFVPVWGPTEGSLQKKAQPWTSATEATRRFEEEVRKKEYEGYEPIEWRAFIRLNLYINELPTVMADPVASGDTARKAWQTRSGKRAEAVLGDGPLARGIDADAAANAALRDVKLDVPPKPKPPEPAPEPERPRMRSVRREMEDLLG